MCPCICRAIARWCSIFVACKMSLIYPSHFQAGLGEIPAWRAAGVCRQDLARWTNRHCKGQLPAPNVFFVVCPLNPTCLSVLTSDFVSQLQSPGIAPSSSQSSAYHSALTVGKQVQIIHTANISLYLLCYGTRPPFSGLLPHICFSQWSWFGRSPRLVHNRDASICFEWVLGLFTSS